MFKINSKQTDFAMVKTVWKVDKLIISKHIHCRVYSRLENCSITSIYFISFLFSIFSRAAVSAVTLPCCPAHLLYLHSVIALSNFEQIKMYVCM